MGTAGMHPVEDSVPVPICKSLCRSAGTFSPGVLCGLRPSTSLALRFARQAECRVLLLQRIVYCNLSPGARCQENEYITKPRHQANCLKAWGNNFRSTDA